MKLLAPAMALALVGSVAAAPSLDVGEAFARATSKTSHTWRQLPESGKIGTLVFVADT
jgi:hypothetical protein